MLLRVEGAGVGALKGPLHMTKEGVEREIEDAMARRLRRGRASVSMIAGQAHLLSSRCPSCREQP